MKNLFFAFALVALCFGTVLSQRAWDFGHAEVYPVFRNQKTSMSQNIVDRDQWWGGIVNGIGSVCGNETLCTRANVHVDSDFRHGITDIMDAIFETSDIKALERGLRLTGNAMIRLGDMIEFCGIQNIYGNWTIVFRQFQIDPTRAIVNLVAGVEKRLSSINIPFMLQVIAYDIKNGLTYDAGFSTGKIIGTFLTPNVSQNMTLVAKPQLTKPL